MLNDIIGWALIAVWGFAICSILVYFYRMWKSSDGREYVEDEDGKIVEIRKY